MSCARDLSWRCDPVMIATDVLSGAVAPTAMGKAMRVHSGQRRNGYVAASPCLQQFGRGAS